MISRRAGILSGLVVCTLICGSAYGQDTRYIGRAIAQLSPDGSTTGDAGAGEKDAQGNVVQETSCDRSVAQCFDETATSAGGSGSPVFPVTVRTFGGAEKADAATPNPGFPFVKSEAGSTVADLSAIFGSSAPPGRIITAGTTATADSDPNSKTFGLSGTSSAALVQIEGQPDTLIAPGAGQTFPFGTVFAGKVTKTEQDGLSVIQVDGAVTQGDNGNFVFSRSVAGVEIPFTTGGGGCSVSRNGRESGRGTFLGMLALLWLVARRRRRSN